MVDQATLLDPEPTAEHDGGPHGREALSLATQIVGALMFSLVWAALCNGLLDVLQPDTSLGYLVDYELDEMRLIFLISTLVVWTVLMLMTALTNRLFLSAGLLLAATILIGVGNAQKLRLRREPIYPSDITFIGQAGFLREMVAPGVLIWTGLGAAAVLVAAACVGRLARRRFPTPRRTERGLWRLWTAVRVVVILTTLALLLPLTSFNERGNLLRRGYEKAGAHWAFWFQEDNYVRHGFVAGFLYNMPVPAMEEPEDYSRARMQQIAGTYAARPPEGASAEAPSINDVNVVIILSEAFSDPLRIAGVRLSEDPLPKTRELMRSTTSGDMLAQLIGGGTANMEFESLTGQSLSQFLPQMNTPYQMLLPGLDGYPSIVGYLRGRGHDAIAVHPYMTTMYKRHEVYPELGFQEFVHDSTMGSSTKIDDSEFISDESSYEEVLRRLRERTRPAFVNLVTMQNHYPMKNQYDDPIGVSGPSGEEAKELAHYARGLKHTDDATADFLDRLRNSAEPTAVIFYGDHLPAFWSPETADRNDPLTMKETPYFLWSNIKDLPARHEDLTSPIYFLPMLWRELGLELPAYYNLLLALHEQIPAMEQGEYYLPDGRMVAEEELPAAAKAVLEDYRMVQYDFSIGKRYAVDAMFPQAD